MEKLITTLKRDNMMLNIGSRIIIVLLVTTAIQDWLSNALSRQIIGFVTISLFLISLVLIAFAYIQTDKKNKQHRYELSQLDIKRSFWLAPFLTSLVGVYIVYLSIEYHFISAWIMWPLFIVVTIYSEFFSYKRKKILEKISSVEK